MATNHPAPPPPPAGLLGHMRLPSSEENSTLTRSTGICIIVRGRASACARKRGSNGSRYMRPNARAAGRSAKSCGRRATWWQIVRLLLVEGP
jgi:hypothetical protein